ncbi:MAG: acetoacetate--CoA ligase [Chloroflexota bacterium]
MTSAEKEPIRLLWEPSEVTKATSAMQHYTNWLNETRGLTLATYDDLWQWSVDHLAEFWETIWDYFEIQSATPYEQVLVGQQMPDFQWFTGTTLNYAEHIFRNETAVFPALIFASEKRPLSQHSWAELRAETAALQSYLRQMGVQPGDRVVAYLPAIREASVGFLAAAALGATWSSCSPDFGTNSVIDRFKQIEPKVLLAVDGYQYGGQPFDRRAEVARLCAALPSLEKVIFVPYLDEQASPPDLAVDVVMWAEAVVDTEAELEFTAGPFDHPIWVLYSSGTTGIPKAITHGHGGVLLEHIKLHRLHNDLKRGDRFFWMSTTGWVMWNIGMGSLLAGTTAVFYEGNPAYPDISRIWQLLEEVGVNLFGTSAAFLIACMKSGLTPNEYNLDGLQAIGSTGSPLPIEAFEWVYKRVKKDVWLASASGGTDVGSGFVGGAPLLPVHAGEIQGRCLGVDVHSLDGAGQRLIDEVGEMVIMQPMPSMPIYFWNDPDKQRYKASYFEMYPGYWQHGDWMRISSLGTIEISGRSDSTLNRMGVRIGSSELYRAVDTMPEVEDSLVIGLELENGRYYMPLFVQLPAGDMLTDGLRDKIKATIRTNFTPRHVPDDIIQIPEVPYTLSGKKLETPIKRLLLGGELEKVVNVDATRSPAAIDFFVAFAAKQKTSA